MVIHEWAFHEITLNPYTHKQLEIHGHVLNNVPTDALTLKHQNTNSSDYLLMTLVQFQSKVLQRATLEKNCIFKTNTQLVKELAWTTPDKPGKYHTHTH